MNNEKKDQAAARAEREALKEFRKQDAIQALTEHERSERAFGENRERLRTERIARETAAGPMLAPTPELPDDIPIARVIFPTRIQKALRAAGIKTVGDVREVADKTLVSLPDLGKGSLSDLRKRLGLPSTDGERPASGLKAK